MRILLLISRRNHGNKRENWWYNIHNISFTVVASFFTKMSLAKSARFKNTTVTFVIMNGICFGYEILYNKILSFVQKN